VDRPDAALRRLRPVGRQLPHPRSAASRSSSSSRPTSTSPRSFSSSPWSSTSSSASTCNARATSRCCCRSSRA
jgi:hypothetical protein